MTTDETPRDWRGTEITAGAPVIYGAGVGRSIELVEAEVAEPMLTKSGRIRLKIVRRAYQTGSSYSKAVVDVGPDRLTVIRPDSLPPTDLPLYTEQIEKSKERMAKLDAIRDTHDIQPVGEWAGGSHYRYKTTVYRCKKCGTSKYYSEECAR